MPCSSLISLLLLSLSYGAAQFHSPDSLSLLVGLNSLVSLFPPLLSHFLYNYLQLSIVVVTCYVSLRLAVCTRAQLMITCVGWQLCVHTC